jgi:uncharacterized protein (TIGR00369 family)
MISPATPDLDHLRAVFDAIPHCREMGLRVDDVASGSARMVLAYRDDLIGNPETGVLHGAVVTTLMDTAAGLAAMASVPDGTPVATLDLRIDYLKPATPGEAVIGEAECYRVTSSVAFVRGVAHHGDATAPIANCAASFMLGSAGFAPRKDQGGEGAP